MNGLRKQLTFIYTLLILSMAFAFTGYTIAAAAATTTTAVAGENWWDVVPEEEVSSPYYDSILYSEIAPILHTISQESDRVDVSPMGKSTGNRNLFLAVIADSGDNQGRFGYYKEIRKLMRTNPAQAQKLLESKNIKVPVFINCSIHGDEYPGVDAGIRLIRHFADDESQEVKDILDNIILLVNVVQNPDGRVLGTRTNAANIDINRDFISMSQSESKATINVVREWNPMVFLDLHGFVEPMLIEPCAPPHLPNAEYDLFIKWALPQAEAMGGELMSRTGYESIIPFKDWPQEWAWDDWSPSYAGVYSILPGSYGHTLETPYRDERGVDAHYAAVMGALKFIAKNKNGMLNDQIEIYRRGFDADPQQLIPDEILEQTEHDQYNALTLGDFPVAYVIPAAVPLQKDPHACADMIDYLITHGVEVKRATEAFTLDGTEYPENTYIVWMNQPKRALANTILESGQDLSSVEGGLVFYSPPVSWSVPLLWGVSQTIVRSTFEVDTANVYKAADPSVMVITEENPVAAAWLPTSLDAYRATGELIYTQGLSVRRATSGFTDGELQFPVGTFIISLEEAITYADRLINTYHLNLYGLQQLPEGTVALQTQSIAITDDPGLMYCLNQLNIEYTVVTGYDGALPSEMADFDLFINSSLYWNVDPEDPDARYKTGLDENGKKWIGDLFGAEKDYIGFFDSGVSLPVDGGFVDITWHTAGEGDGIISLDYDVTEPVGAGFGTDAHAYIHAPIWFTAFGESVRSVADIASGDYFISGYWPQWQTSGAAGMPVILHGETGNQDTVLMGMDPIFRCHPRSTFKLVANAIYSCQE